jgi:CheY-like chemotaxis protein
MGGTVGAQSEVGVGSVFWVELSAAQEVPHAMDAKQGPVVASPLKNLAEEATLTILYVEDNPANAQLVEQILADRPNLRLLLAHDGAQGIELARRHRPQCDPHGYQSPWHQRYGDIEDLAPGPCKRVHIPAVAVSANAMPMDVVNGLSAGFFRYLTKPFKITEFLEVLDMALVFSPDIAA